MSITIADLNRPGAGGVTPRYILARQEDRGAADRGVPTATALVLSFDGAWEDLAPETCAMRVFYTPPTR